MSVKYLFQRIIQNHFQWTRPSPGRLGPSGEGQYVKENGFGHEDWNFNKNLLVDGCLQGYCCYRPREAIKDEAFNIAFATYENRQWYLIGFYLECKFMDDPPVSKEVVLQKIRDLQQLGTSLGKSYRRLKEKYFFKTIWNDSQLLNWRVKPENAVITNQPIPIPRSIFDTRNYRIVKPTELDKKVFDSLYKLAENTNLIDYAEEVDFPEGREQEIRHKMRERNPALIKKVKDVFKNKHGHLFCEVCGFDFHRKYGIIGSGFIEAHHTTPLSQLSGETNTRLKDIALVCSNCHRMLHRKRPWLEMKHLKRLIVKNAK